MSPLWTPDGQSLVFSWLKDGRRCLARHRADTSWTTTPEVLLAGGGDPKSWTSDGRLVVLGSNDVQVATLGNGRVTMQPLAQTPQVEEGSPEVSPDGRWLAYGSNDTGRREIYVQPYPGTGRRIQVSNAGGIAPAWNPRGGELFFVGLPVQGTRWMMAAHFGPGSPPLVGTPQPLFDIPKGLIFGGSESRFYDVTPNGQRFFVMQVPPGPRPITYVNLIEHWVEELKAKAPVK